ncbi:MAG TPA: GntP family permease [Methanomicrobia archaeon]|nr:GntP family permease [Methanomicrobia archaeon]
MSPLIIFLLALALILVLTTILRIHPFLSLLGVSIFVAIAAGRPFAGLESLLTGMSRVLYQLGIIIVCGSIIGTILEGIGGTTVIADDIIRLTKRPVLALNMLGFLVALPVMCCILAYIILIPIAREIALRQKIPVGVVATSLSLGTLASYELIYPAPGVYSAATELGVVGPEIVLLGVMIAIPTSLVGYWYAQRFCRVGAIPVSTVGTVRARASRLRAYPPILVPVVLIFAQLLVPRPVLDYVGDPNIALLIGVALAFLTTSRLGQENRNLWTGEAVRRGGGILMVLCAGGALGAVLGMTGVGLELSAVVIKSGLPALFIPFLLAVAIQTVQGSRLVTFIVVPGLLAPILPSLGLHPLLVLFALASGTFMISHANDAYFWTVVELAELTPAAGYRCYTLGGMVLGVIALGITLLLHFSGMFAV